MRLFALRNLAVLVLGIIFLAVIHTSLDMVNEIGLRRSLPTLLTMLAIIVVFVMFLKWVTQKPKVILKQTELKNEKVRSYLFLKEMYRDAHFPDFLVDKGKDILVELCFEIEQQQPKNLEELYNLTHTATNKFNQLQYEFEANDSEIETAARDCIGMDFAFIAKAYGFDADTEELISTRDW